jgi:hypothetical protein
MVSLLVAVDWLALLQVAGVTIAAAVAISGLLSLANWLWTPAEGLEEPLPVAKGAGYAVLGLMGLMVAFGLYLMIPYFH